MRHFLRRLFGLAKTANVPLDEIDRARQLIAAIDAGGIPLDPRRLTRIAEDLGLEVGRGARPEDTIRRIRAALERHNTSRIGG